jgi:histone deacetylase 1/2
MVSFKKWALLIVYLVLMHIQQNNSAERKHCHIVEIGLTLLAYASMPLKFWDEAFLTAIFLINMLRSKVIDFATPVEKLLQTKPNYDSLRIFGYTCWPNLRPYNKRKLAFCSKQCVFLGYSLRHKGVKCFDVKARRLYISRDVVFDENVFPFASLHLNDGQILRRELLLLPHDSPSSYVGDAQIDDPMTIPILHAINPHRHDAEHILSDDSSSDDEDPAENRTENGENLTRNDSVQENTEEDNVSTRSGDDSPSTSDPTHIDPEADSP